MPTILFLACHAVFSVVIGVLGDLFTQQLTREFGERLRRLHDFLDRFAVDRLLFDRTETRSLPASRLRTALGAAILGAVFGAMTTLGWHETAVWTRLFLVTAGFALVAYPQVATRRHRQREGQGAELRAGYESALAIVGILVVTSGEPTAVAWIGIALVVVGWIACWWTHPDGSVRMREFIERIAPDRLLGTKPAFLGVTYLGLLLIAVLQFFAPPQDTPGAPKPGPTPGTGGTTATGEGGTSGALGTGGAPAGTGGELATGGVGGTASTDGVIATGSAERGGVSRDGTRLPREPKNTGGTPNTATGVNTATGGVPVTKGGANGGFPTMTSGGAPSTGTGGVPVPATGGVSATAPTATGSATPSTTAEERRAKCLLTCSMVEDRCIMACNSKGESSLDDYGVELKLESQTPCETACKSARQTCDEACVPAPKKL